jgi:hypothetical protein
VNRVLANPQDFRARTVQAAGALGAVLLSTTLLLASLLAHTTGCTGLAGTLALAAGLVGTTCVYAGLRRLSRQRRAVRGEDGK